MIQEQQFIENSMEPYELALVAKKGQNDSDIEAAEVQSDDTEM